MTRDEEIWNAISKLRLGDYSDDGSLGNDEYNGDDLQDAFFKGAKWADSNQKSPWISVDEDLPCNHEELLEDYGEELLKDYGYETVSVIIKSKYSKSPSTDFMRRLDKGNWVWMRNLAITHWMPFPEPPKE